jgi:hypothetical protein
MQKNMPVKLLFVAICCLMQQRLWAQTNFPLQTSDNRRYLVDNNDKPFPILGRTSWCVITQPEKGYHQYIENTVAHGYNAIEVSILVHWPFVNHPPFNGRNDAPFDKRLDGSPWKGSLVYKDTLAEAPDLTTPNERYWSYVDTFLNFCESKGVVVLMFPAYVGYDGGDQGWMQELLANGPDKVKKYGAWIAERYKNQKNIIWMLLGDQGKFTPKQVEAEASLIAGLKSVPGQQSTHYSAESYSGQNSIDQTDFGHEMNLNGVYTWDSVGIPTLAKMAYSHTPVVPAFLLEEPYDEEGPDGTKYNPHAIQPVRRFQYWGWLGTVGGYMAGNGYIYPFIDPQWQEHLNTKTTLDMSVLNKFIRSIEWWRLVPSGMDGMKNIIVEGEGKDSATNFIASAATKSGDMMIAYVPPAHDGKFKVDMSVMQGKFIAQWMDPSTGEKKMIKNYSSGEFTVPGKNKSGYDDWVLLFTSKK